MYPYMAVELIDAIQHLLVNHPAGVPPHLQILGTLRFLAEGSYQKGSGNDLNHPISQTTVSKYLYRVIPVINTLTETLIKFPATPEERAAVQVRFQERIGFPGVIGAIDCTLPKIIAYLNYKRQHSLCLQVVADMDYNILSFRICSGSTNDRFAWRWSDIRQHMYELRENEGIVRNEGLFYLIGDGGYTASRVLLTPVQRAARGTPAAAFSDALRGTRFVVENVFGIVKERWRCLNTLRGLHYEPIVAAQIVQACLTLHNYLRRHGLPIPDVVNDQPAEFNINYPADNFNDNDHEEYLRGQAERQRIINLFFN